MPAKEAAMAESSSPVAAGVQELIAKLRGEGVDAGREEAARILAEARRRAGEILEDAQREAADTVGIARATADAELRAMRDALRLAQRDTVLALKEELGVLLRERLHGAVREAVREPEALRTALAVALDALARTGADSAELQPGADSEALLQGPLRGLLELLLSRGVVLRAGLPQAVGLRLRLNGQGIEVDLTDEALAELLAARLIPRFQALLAGGAG
jgi:V/A-type H+-transporting ATPase subunit E